MGVFDVIGKYAKYKWYGEDGKLVSTLTGYLNDIQSIMEQNPSVASQVKCNDSVDAIKKFLDYRIKYKEAKRNDPQNPELVTMRAEAKSLATDANGKISLLSKPFEAAKQKSDALWKEKKKEIDQKWNAEKQEIDKQWEKDTDAAKKIQSDLSAVSKIFTDKFSQD